MGKVFVLSASLDGLNSVVPVMEEPLSVAPIVLDVADGVDRAVHPIGRMMLEEPAHVDTVHLRRSARSNKYGGFRVPPVTDKRATTSNVKPRKEPFLPGLTISSTPSVGRHDKVSDAIPPPTSIHAIQSIGTNMCGVHQSQLKRREAACYPRWAEERCH